MKITRLTLLTCVVILSAAGAVAWSPAVLGKPAALEPNDRTTRSETLIERLMKPMSSTTYGNVTVKGQTIHYKAVAGTLVIGGPGTEETTPWAAMSYVAYFKRGANPSTRPITFLYNGGPGSSTIWLLMGAFGPKRVVTNDHTQTPAAPYQLVNNNYSLLNASDLVFVDMPGTGFGRLLPQGKAAAARAKDQKKIAKQIWGVDGDAHAFARFITEFLTKYGRWNSPKFLYGESYGTTRTAVLVNILEEDDGINLNGVILQSTVLNYCDSIDGPRGDPGIEEPYILALPTYAATAWYHHRLPMFNKGKLGPLLTKVIHFAWHEYAPALFAGSTLSRSTERAIAVKLHEFTGLPTSYWIKADLQVTGGMFEHELLNSSDETTGRLDSRFSGPSMDPTGGTAKYDPQGAAISSAYISAFNDYVRKDLKFGMNMTYWPSAEASDFTWNNLDHKVLGMSQANNGSCILNVMPDLASAMKYDPDLKVMLNAGYYDLATPFYTAVYDMHHLQIPRKLEHNITYAFYRSGHMIYVHVPSLRLLHNNVTKFIETTDSQS